VRVTSLRGVLVLSLQLVLLTSVKDVANALKNLIDATRQASGKSVQDPAMEALKTSAKVGGTPPSHVSRHRLKQHSENACRFVLSCLARIWCLKCLPC